MYLSLLQNYQYSIQKQLPSFIPRFGYYENLGAHENYSCGVYSRLDLRMPTTKQSVLHGVDCINRLNVGSGTLTPGQNYSALLCMLNQIHLH